LNHIHVTCAIIERNGLILVAQRNTTMSLPLKWEFPGGKIDPGESAEECLQREITEELGIRICLKRSLPAQTHKYPAFKITLYPFVCSIESGEIILHDHSAILWRQPQELNSLDWADADVPVLKSYLQLLL